MALLQPCSSYTFEIKLNHLEAVLREDGSVSITDPDTDEVVYTIPKGICSMLTVHILTE